MKSYYFNRFFDTHPEFDLLHNLHEELLGDFLTPRHAALHGPTTNIYENESHIIFEVDMPGVKKEEIRIEMIAGFLKISGKRADISKDAKIIRQERPTFNFSRSYKIPDAAQTDKCEAVYQDGILKITLAKSEEVKPKTIAIQ